VWFRGSFYFKSAVSQKIKRPPAERLTIIQVASSDYPSAQAVVPAVSVAPALGRAAAPAFADASLVAQRAAPFADGLAVDASLFVGAQSHAAARVVDIEVPVCAQSAAAVVVVSPVAVAASGAPSAPFVFRPGGAVHAAAGFVVERRRAVAAVK
jgi:hypothetical protein